jgi:hypothetical protein
MLVTTFPLFALRTTTVPPVSAFAQLANHGVHPRRLALPFPAAVSPTITAEIVSPSSLAMVSVSKTALVTRSLLALQTMIV